MNSANHTDAEIGNPRGRIYRSRHTRMCWTVELEIGGLAWLRSDEDQIIKARMREIETDKWERIA